MHGLMLHVGANAASLDEIAALPCPVNTETYFPTPHITVIEQVKNSLNNLGYQIASEAYGIAREKFFGLIEVRSDYQDRSTVIGLRNSHDKSFPIGLASGNQVFVCDNLSFSGEIVIRRKHTRFAERDLPLLINNAVGKLEEFEMAQDARIGTYKMTDLTNSQVDLALMQMLRSQIFPGSAIPKVLEEYENPSHPEFAKDGNTIWRLYNAATEHMKNSLWNLPKRSIALHAILDSFCQAPIEGIIINEELFALES